MTTATAKPATMVAYNGVARAKATYLKYFDETIKRYRLVFVSGTGGVEKALGLDPAVAHIAAHLGTHRTPAGDEQSYGVRFAHSIEVGADLSGIVSQFAIELLTGKGRSVLEILSDPIQRSLIESLAEEFRNPSWSTHQRSGFHGKLDLLMEQEGAPGLTVGSIHARMFSPRARALAAASALLNADGFLANAKRFGSHNASVHLDEQAVRELMGMASWFDYAVYCLAHAYADLALEALIASGEQADVNWPGQVLDIQSEIGDDFIRLIERAPLRGNL